MRYKYGFDNIENYIRLLHYIILSDKDNRITDLEKVDLMIDELSIILNIKNLKEQFNNYLIQCAIQIESEKKDAERLKKRRYTILTKDIITNQGYYNKIDETPRSILYKHICNDSYAYDYMENYINLMLTDEKQSKNIIKDKEFFLVEYASYLASNLARSKSKYTDKQAKELHLALNYLEIIDVYLESNKQISPLIIKKATSDQDKISCFITILKLISDLDSKRFITVREKLNDVWVYNNIIDNLILLDLSTDIETLKSTNILIDELIFKYNKEKKSIDEYETDRDNLINEIILDINSIINKTKKNDIIVIEEKKDSIIDEHEEIYKEIQKKLNNYISYDGVEKYKTMINYKINNKNFNNIDGRSYFIMKSNTKRDICKFAQCFNITLKEAEKIFKNIEKKNINLNTKDSVTINMTDPNDFEKALIEVRNECLHKINPEKFKLL